MSRRKLRAAIVAALKSYPLISGHGQPLCWTIGRDARVTGDGHLGPLADHLVERWIEDNGERWAEGGGE